jgi:hypothetical protein
MWYWDGNSLYRKMTFPKRSAPVSSCIYVDTVPQQSSWQGRRDEIFLCSFDLHWNIVKPSMSGTGHLSIMYTWSLWSSPPPAAALQGLSISRHSSPITLRIFSQLFRIPKAVNKKKLNIPATVCILWSGWGEIGEGEEGDMKMKKGDKNLVHCNKILHCTKRNSVVEKFLTPDKFLILYCALKIKVRSNC